MTNLKYRCCSFCGAAFNEEDDVFQVITGHMAWGDISSELFCDPNHNFDGDVVEQFYHDICLLDGPAREDNIEVVPPFYMDEYIPTCSICEEELEAGDSVYCLLKGSVCGGELSYHPHEIIHSVADNPLVIRSLYTHIMCVSNAAAVMLPDEPSYY